MTVILDFKATAKRWARYGEEYLAEARKHYFQSIKNGFEISTFLLGFNIIWLQISPDPISSEIKIFCTLSLLSLSGSLLMGLYSIIKINKFLNKSGRKYENQSSKLKSYMVDTGKDRGNSYPEYLWMDEESKYHFNPWQHISQLILLAGGFFFSLLVGIWFLWF